jgi:hypothetical protein
MGDTSMRIATFLSVAAIAATASIAPALAYGPAATAPSHSYLTGGQAAASVKAASQETQVAYFRIRKKTNGKYVIIQMDNGEKFPGCEKKANCVTDNGNMEFEGLIIPKCDSAPGECVIVGKPSSE